MFSVKSLLSSLTVSFGSGKVSAEVRKKKKIITQTKLSTTCITTQSIVNL